MSVMSAAEADGVAGTSPGPPDAGSWEESSGADSSRAPRPERTLRLVATELHVTEVRVAREVSVRTVRADGTGVSAPGAARSQVSARRMTAPAASARQTTMRQASARQATLGQKTARQAGWPPAGGPGVGALRISVQRASARRVNVQRTSTHAASAQPGGLRLTRRGRRVLTVLVMLVIVSAAMLLWTSVAGGAQAASPGAPARSAYQGMTQIVVRPGQTVWSIAAAAEPSADPWSVVQQISDVNALNGTQIKAGQLLWVPRG